jgi:hypothetical protein
LHWLEIPYRVALARRSLALLFPAATRLLGETNVCAIATISYVVGMYCPGRHSMMSSCQVKLSLDVSREKALGFTVEHFDSRFQRAVLRLSGAVSGEVKAFVRPQPALQPPLAELAHRVTPGEFAGQTVLIIGGSRGLGEVTAKLMAAGGAEVILTWAEGHTDAMRVASEIQGAGFLCTVARFRAGPDDPTDLLRTVGPISLVFYFATPKIFKKGTPMFDPILFAEFSDVYSSAFARLCVALDDRRGREIVRVFLPSSSAIDSRPKGLTEYAMAKIGAELLADDLNQTLQGVTIVSERLPRTVSDQTASVVAFSAVPAADVMLPVIRRISQ